MEAGRPGNLESGRQRGPVTGRKARSGLEAGKQGSSAAGRKTGSWVGSQEAGGAGREAERPGVQAGRPRGCLPCPWC